MELGDLTLEVRDKNLKRVGVILPDEATFTLRDEFNNVGSWEINLPLEHPLTDKLRTPGAGIRVTGPAGVLLTGPMVTASSKGSRDDPEGMVTFTGVTDDVILNDYLAYPVPENPTMAGQAARANDVRTGKAETVMHQFVNANLGPSAPAARRCALLTMGTNGGRGPDVYKSARFPMMGNLLSEIAVLGNLGYRVIQRGSNLVFETYAQSDKRKQIRMDLWNNTLASYELTIAGAAVTHVIVAGQEEGVDRQLVERTTAESLAQMALWGRRKEKFLDRRSTDEITELEQAGDEVLSEQGIDQSVVKFVPMDETTMRYQVDWKIGDIVTAVIEGREVPAVVTAAIIKVDTNGVRVACALGDLSASDERAEIRNFMAGTETRLSVLERNAETSSLTPIAVAASTDLNALRTRGVYTVDSGAIAQTVRNIPTPVWGRLDVTVTADGRGILQRYTTGGRGIVFERSYHSTAGSWYPWVATNGTIAVQSDTDLEALVDHYRPSSNRPLTIYRADILSTAQQRFTPDGFRWFDMMGNPQPAMWKRLTLPGWADYGGGYAAPGYVKTASGIVVLKGLIQGGTAPSIITNVLPVGYRPDNKIMIPVAAGNNFTGAIDIFPNGDIQFRSMTAGSWVSLDNIMFPAADPNRVWTTVTAYTQGYFADYSPLDGTWPPLSYWVDPYGRVWWQGLFRNINSVAAPTSDIGAFWVTPSVAPSQTTHFGGFCSGGSASYHITNTGQLAVKAGTKGQSWLTLSGAPAWVASTIPEGAWGAMAFSNAWVNYGGGNATGGYYLAADGIMSLRGLIRSGTNATMAWNAPAPYRGGAERRIYQVNSSNAAARTDLAANSQIVPMTGTPSAWTSLNNINYIVEA